MMTIRLPAPGGRVVEALVDDADHQRLARFQWRQLPSGYVVRRQRHVGGARRYYYLHREIVGATHGDLLKVDHLNGQKLDNRRSNLRVRSGLSATPRAHAFAAVADLGDTDLTGAAS